jgi:hypothetical protein
MKVDIILSKRGSGYLAQVSNLPEIRAKEATREAALRGVERRLRAYFDRVELVRLDLGTSSNSGDSLLNSVSVTSGEISKRRVSRVLTAG